MKEIKLLMEHIEDELEDAHTYAELAVEYKHEDPELADLFYRLSGEEMNHMNALHKAVVSHIEEYRKQKGEPPAAMMAATMITKPPGISARPSASSAVSFGSCSMPARLVSRLALTSNASTPQAGRLPSVVSD